MTTIYTFLTILAVISLLGSLTVIAAIAYNRSRFTDDELRLITFATGHEPRPLFPYVVTVMLSTAWIFAMLIT